MGYVAGGAIDQQYPQHLDTSLGPNAPGTAGRLQLLVVIRNTSIFEIRLLSTVTFNILIEKTNHFFVLTKNELIFRALRVTDRALPKN